MTTLSLRIEKDLAVATEAGAVATLHRVADEAGAAIRGGKRVEATIPASLDPTKVKRLTIDPGRWWVEATLPSGEVISDEVNVRKDEDAAVTLYPAQRSPHKWLGWQHLVGNIEGLETFTGIVERARRDPVGYARDIISQRLDQHVPAGLRELVKRTLDAHLPKGARGAGLAEQRDPFASAGEPVIRLCHRFGASALRGRGEWTSILAPGEPESSPHPTFMRSLEEGFATYRFGDLAKPPARDFAHVEWSGERYVVSLPLPWMTARGEADVELMVRMHPLGKSVSIGVVVLDSEFGTLAGLMTSSTLPKARIFVDQARDLLFGKMVNRLAAAAGGYVLVATSDAEVDPEWHAWIENLANWFPDLPDGAVLEATRRLRYPHDEKCYDIAKARLFEAFDRGIPYFSVGVAWLLDGLTLFSDEDPEAKERMQIVHRVAQRLDVAQAFTVVRLSDKARQR